MLPDAFLPHLEPESGRPTGEPAPDLDTDVVFILAAAVTKSYTIKPPVSSTSRGDKTIILF